MNKLTLKQIRDIEPCYDPTRFVNEDWTGTVLDILKMEDVPAKDRIWVVTHFLDDKTNRLSAVYCARQALKLVDNPDLRSIEACNVAEAFAYGKATEEELAAAGDAAWAAAGDADGLAAWAAWAAAAAAAAAAWDAAWDAARDAAGSAAGDAGAAAGAAAWDAARDAARDAQIKNLIELCSTD